VDTQIYAVRRGQEKSPIEREQVDKFRGATRTKQAATYIQLKTGRQERDKQKRHKIRAGHSQNKEKKKQTTNKREIWTTEVGGALVRTRSGTRIGVSDQKQTAGGCPGELRRPGDLVRSKFDAGEVSRPNENGGGTRDKNACVLKTSWGHEGKGARSFRVFHKEGTQNVRARSPFGAPHAIDQRPVTGPVVRSHPIKKNDGTNGRKNPLRGTKHERVEGNGGQPDGVLKASTAKKKGNG